MRILLMATAGFLATPALAEAQMNEVADRLILPGLGISADIADDLDVHDASGRKIGEVEEVVGVNADAAEALVVDFEDEITQYGREDRIIPLISFTFDGSAMVLDEGTDVLGLPVWRD